MSDAVITSAFRLNSIHSRGEDGEHTSRGRQADENDANLEIQCDGSQRRTLTKKGVVGE